VKDIAIPGRDPLHLKYLVLDMNGALALDGQLIPGVHERLELLNAQLEIWLISADTYGTLSAIAPTLKVNLRRMEPQAANTQKEPSSRNWG
jgi:soluble P-type ATPase